MSVKAPASRNKRESSKPAARKTPPTISRIGVEKSRVISERGRKLLIDRYAPE